MQSSQVPLQNFREVPPPLPRRVHLARIESARRCWLHVHRDADHAKTFNEALRRKFTCVAAHPFVGQDSRTSVAEFTVSDFIATLNYHSHVEADNGNHNFSPPRQICRAWCRAAPCFVAQSVLRGVAARPPTHYRQGYMRHCSTNEIMLYCLGLSWATDQGVLL